ncbi:hypothetical protein [Nocardioides yefusunii]|uniref:Uncharacterized protein n=1 Tax=Nocardioides yefusunii TaxID=2500546 RepID=A0ABW1QSU2_9ACTN|nr:hypothetical protein [Nocardioides yefusunii]
MTQTEVRETMYVTNAHGKVHVRPCPHLNASSTLTEATAEQVEANGLCVHCAREINGEGRTYFTDLTAALSDFGHGTDEARRLIDEALSGVEHDVVWVPASSAYVALGAEGEGVAWIGKGSVSTKVGGTTELPWFRPVAATTVVKEDLYGEVCEIHFVVRSLNGECDICD